MILFLVLILALCLYKVNVKRVGFYEDFLGREQTNSIKGIFILFVFIRHVLQYIESSGYEFISVGDKIFRMTNAMAGQLIVVMFLFYSGYGVMEAIRNKGDQYVLRIPKHRILPTIINFDVAVLFFLVVTIAFEKPFSCMQIILSMVCWDSLGNSNWYIFDIILCYFTSFIMFRFTNNYKYSFCLGGGVIVASIFLLNWAGKPTCWYNTLCAYLAGMMFSVCKQRLIHLWSKKYWQMFLLIGCIFMGLYFMTYVLKSGSFAWIVCYNLVSVVFALLVVQITMKLKVSNDVLIWLGINLFPLYIYQRLPMVVLYEIDKGMFVQNYVVVYMAICCVVTGCVAFLYKFWKV